MKTIRFLIAAAVFALCFFSACSKSENEETSKSQVETLAKQVEELKTAQGLIEAALTDLGLEVDGLGETVDGLVTKYQDLESQLETISEDVEKMEKTVTELTSEIDKFKKDQADLNTAINLRLGRLENCIQSIVVIPDYSTGAVKVDVTKAYINFHIRPFAIADSLVKLHNKSKDIFKVAAVEREAVTKAIPSQFLTLDTVEFHAEDSTVMIKADATLLSLNTNNYVASLIISTGKISNISKQSEYFPLKEVLPDSLSFWGTPQEWHWEQPKQHFKCVAPGIYEDTVYQNFAEATYYAGYFFTPYDRAVIDCRYFKSYIGEVSTSTTDNQIQFNNGSAINGTYSVLVNLNDRSIAAYRHATKGYKYLGDTLYFSHKAAEYNNQKLVKVDYGKYSGFIFVPDSAAHGQFPFEEYWGSHEAGAINAGSFKTQIGVHQEESVGWDTVFEGDKGPESTGDGGAYWVEMDFYRSTMTATKMKNMKVFGQLSDWKEVEMQLDTAKLRFFVKKESLSLGNDANFKMIQSNGAGWEFVFDGEWDDVNHLVWGSRDFHDIHHTTTAGQDFYFYPTRQTSKTMYCKQE